MIERKRGRKGPRLLEAGESERRQIKEGDRWGKGKVENEKVRKEYEKKRENGKEPGGSKGGRGCRGD